MRCLEHKGILGAGCSQEGPLQPSQANSSQAERKEGLWGLTRDCASMADRNFFSRNAAELSRSGPAQTATTISLPWLAQLPAAVASFLRSPCLLLAPQVYIQMLHQLHGRGDSTEGTETIVCGILPVAMLATTSVLSPWCEKVVRLPHEYYI